MKVMFISLGCDKNLVDSEMMLGMLSENGHTFTDDEDEADIIVVNTCCFIHDAKQESVDTILEIAERKKDGSLKGLVVTGCLAQRYREEIQTEIPEVDAILGTNAIDAIAEAKRFGIAPERAVRYECDAVGTAVNFRALGKAVSRVRSCAAADMSEALSTGWKEEIEADYRKRGK